MFEADLTQIEEDM